VRPNQLAACRRHPQHCDKRIMEDNMSMAKNNAMQPQHSIYIYIYIYRYIDI
jgi:hypothetical protein